MLFKCFLPLSNLLMKTPPRHDSFLYSIRKLKNSHTFCAKILPYVSRTFALNIRFLRGKTYWSILVSYLICRILDTIEDSDLPPHKKVTLLQNFPAFLNPQESYSPSQHHKTEQWIQQTQPITHITPAEKLLIERTQDVFKVYHWLPKAYKQCLYSPIIEMANGMATTIHDYQINPSPTQHPHLISHFKTWNELITYCYYVAGTVGKLITNVFLQTLKCPSVQHRLQKYQITFGLGLQTTNIAKDFMKDYQRGWCYIPLSLMRTSKINLHDFAQKTFPQANNHVMFLFLKRIKGYFELSIRYIQAIPFWHVHKRLFCLLPLLLGLRTLSHLERNYSLPPKNTPSRMTRKEVYFLVFLSLLSAWNNALLNLACKQAASPRIH